MHNGGSTRRGALAGRHAAVIRRPITGVVIANELLDNLPFRLAVFDGGWREVVVSIGRDSDFVESTVQRRRPEPGTGSQPWPPTARGYPSRTRRPAWVSTAQRSCFVKEVSWPSTTARRRRPSSAARPWRDWLRTYRAPRPRRALPRHPGSTGHHRAGVHRPATVSVTDRGSSQLPAADSGSTTRRGRPPSLGGRGCTARPRGDDDAQPGERSRGAAGAPWPWGVQCGHLAGGRRLSRIGVMAAQGGLSHRFANVPSGVTT